jgi:hypothetical protein
MPSVGAWMTHGECSTRWPHPMWSLGLPCYWDIWKMVKGRKHWSYFQWMQQEGVEPDPVTFVGVLNACASVEALEDGRCVFMSWSFEVVASLICLWTWVALLTCTQNVGAWKTLQEDSTRFCNTMLSLWLSCFKDLPCMGQEAFAHFEHV